MTARELFEGARRASARIEELLLEEGAPLPSPRRGGPHGAGGTSDPTAALAARELDGGADAARELEACMQAVDEARQVVDGIRRLFETPWWRVLELYYIDRLTWDGVSRETGVPRRTCVSWRDAAFDFVDSFGIAHAKHAAGVAGRP